MPSDSTLSAALDGLDPEQRQVALAPRGPICVLAGAGTGKTRALTHRIAHLVHSGQANGDEVLAVTFTARAASELRARLRGLGVAGVPARTFHAAALRQLRYFWPTVIGGQPPSVIPGKAAMIAEAASRTGVRPNRMTVRDLAAEVEWAKVTQIRPEDFAISAAQAARVAPADLTVETVADVYEAYEAVKRERGVIDFEDVLLLTAAMLDDDVSMAANVRGQYRCFVVDEYQDVSPAQQRLLELWLGDRDDVTVVGDASQTIYSFAGATPSYLLEFSSRYPQAETIRLIRNYRSSPQIVEAANNVIRSATGQAANARLQLVSQQTAGPSPTSTEFPDEPAEAAGVAARIAKLLAQGQSAKDIAVLFRINAQSEVYEDALSQAGIPYVVRGGERFFDRPEVRDGISLIRGATRAGEASDDLSRQVRDILATAGFRDSQPPGPGEARNRWESLAALVALADEVVTSKPGATLIDLLTELEHRAAAQHAPAVDGVTLATLHAAKGLEWQAVFLVGLVDGTLPITYANTPEQIEEERRLLYVGVTRAIEHLWFSWAGSRLPGGKQRRRPSRFLSVSSSTRRTGGGQPKRVRARTASCVSCGRALTTPLERKLRHCSQCEVTVDLDLFEHLRRWRKGVAETESVPAFVVFTDATLTAVASDKPTDSHGLLAIPGIGATKNQRYGQEILTIVAEHEAPATRQD